jgi:16S rRNA (adenine1518-N6/adenine1519-N6)-dimethyltransferase
MKGFLTPKEIKNLLEEYGASPRKSLGQNFLINAKIRDDILKTAELKKSDVVLEVGPGLGVMTESLSRKVKKVIAVETDKKLVEILREIFRNSPNIEIIKGDILKLNPEALGFKTYNYKIVANLPYQITSNFLRQWLEAKEKPKLMALTIQKEVAQRIVAKPPKMNLLALSVNFFAQAEIIRLVRPGSFWPKPKVDSTIIKIIPREKLLAKIPPEFFFKITRAAFQKKRKKISNTLSEIIPNKETLFDLLESVNVSQNARPQEISLQKWITLAESTAEKLL